MISGNRTFVKKNRIRGGFSQKMFGSFSQRKSRGFRAIRFGLGISTIEEERLGFGG